MTKKITGKLNLKVTEDWDPDSKEPWLLEFEKQPVNDERWTCLVTSAVPAKVEDDECVKIYKECVASGSQKAVKIISMSDVVKLVKERGSTNGSKTESKKVKAEKREKSQRKDEKPPSPRLAQIMSLVLKYVTCSEYECKLPPDLMAVLLKYLILKLKEENIEEKKIAAVRRRKVRERTLTAKFIRELKPFESVQRDAGESPRKVEGVGWENEILSGPDLYIMLTDFFDVLTYPELQRINVPFVAFVKVIYAEEVMQTKKSTASVAMKSDVSGNKGAAIEEFWKNLRENCVSLEKTHNFKDIIVMKYSPTFVYKFSDKKGVNDEIIFHEMFSVQCAAYCVYCQHQQYLQNLYVQKVTQSLERLDLSKCDVYNKLCDALVTGQPLTPLLVLYSMIEQLVVGIPETQSAERESDRKVTDFFPTRSESTSEESSSSNLLENLVTPCEQCRNKATKYLSVCHAYSEDSQPPEKSERSNHYEDKEVKEGNYLCAESFTKSESNTSDRSGESSIFTGVIDQVLSERKTEKEIRKEKTWKPPRICAYGDSVTLQTYHCDPRLIDPEELVQRFMRNADLLKIWTKYSELSPGGRAFYNFHYESLLKISKEKEESFRIKIIFTLLMKVAGMSRFYIFSGDEENLSKKASIIQDQQRTVTSLALSQESENDCISNNFSGKFILDLFREFREMINPPIQSSETPEASNLRFSREESNVFAAGNRSSVVYRPPTFRHLESLSKTNVQGKIRDILQPLLECFDISALADFTLVSQFAEFSQMVESFSFYENLKPALMIQRLLEHREEFNTVHCSYFPLTDSVVILMHNNSDHRGIFCRVYSGRLPTPVALRDFYNHVYKEVRSWIADEFAENAKFNLKLVEKKKAKEEKKDEKFLLKLKEHYCRLNETGRKDFLEQEIDMSEPEVTEKELRDLPYKIKQKTDNSRKTSFVVTDLGDLRVETNQKVQEFHSKDGTEVRVALDCWLYDPSEQLALTIRRSSLWFRYYMALRDESTDFAFTLKTASDIIFVFFKEPETSTEESAPFNVRISWPTGLLIEVKSLSNLSNSNRYIKQSYIRTYRKGWNIEDEKSRCYVTNGNILIFKEVGEITVLTISGTVHRLYYGELPRCETTTMTGEVWGQRIGKTRCRKRKKISSVKIYMGVDSKTQETYYRRDDGTSCMLWPNGKMVTKYPDGTKITSVPDFDEEGVKVEWSEEEKRYFLELETEREKEEEEEKNETSRRNKSVTEQGRPESDEFVTVSCTYLMEHPKYSTVYCETSSSLIEIKMLEELKLKVLLNGCYEVEKENVYLSVSTDIVQFNSRCEGCEKSSTAVMNFDSDILCHCVDLFENEYIVHKDGEIIFQDNTVSSGDLTEGGDITVKRSVDSYCPKPHAVNMALKQRCFVLERDLSGMEFIHVDNVSRYCYDLPRDSYFDLNTNDPSSRCHTFSSSLVKIGYENWVMDYERDDCLPTNLKKKDLKDLEVKENRNKLFKYPFPQGHDFGKCQNNRPRQKIRMPKVKLVRTIKCLPAQSPGEVINDIFKYVTKYRKRALDLYDEYENFAVPKGSFDDATNVKMRLKKIAVTLSQSLTLYPHVCAQLPSTEKDVHYFGHLINTMEEMKAHFKDECDLLPKCKQIPGRLPRRSDFQTIREEDEPHNA